MKHSKKRRFLTVVSLPVIVFVFMVGWALYYFGKRQQGTSHPKQASNSLTLAVAEPVEVELT